MRSGANLSFLVDGDDVAFPALKLDPDTKLARVVPADVVEVRQRAFFTMLSAVAMIGSRISRCLEWIATIMSMATRGFVAHNRESGAYALTDSGRATLTAILEGAP
jgi:hypothetical protein